MKPLLLLISFFSTFTLYSQTLEANLQIRPRFEFRNGYKSLLSQSTDPAAHISQRSRINLLYDDSTVKVKISAQAIGVWGESSTMRLQDTHAFSIFEAYGQYYLSHSFFFRIGRQVLSYDNQRILGEVDWAQQGQSHDALLFSWRPRTGKRLEVAFAYNNETETLVLSPYLVNSYKNLQLAWYHVEYNRAGFSFLLMNTGYEYENIQQEREVDYLQTFGLFHRFFYGKFFGDISVYGQTGEAKNKEVSGWYGGININYSLNNNWKAGAGAEYLSGTDMNAEPSAVRSFTPLFGTNHAFNGYMDYFYVGNHQHSLGLLDLFGRFSYSTTHLEIALMPHLFSAAATLTDAAGKVQDNYLGTEIDLTAGYVIRKDLKINLGYSQMFGSKSLELLKGGDKNRIQNWAWIMINFSPELILVTKKNH